ncbi:hypothetical protein A6P39_040205 [Streptomyces sp. FXJ1.172]|uniref:hypothetical protein n=1 Tax=Streptomyces sp. FXJ1.172 TaxID=710705 RepID=UPI001331A4F3|nr:hypothetical protein [Streptomyces sp. FXJ1.172]WEO99771.1 hypothetical protein A6P39_040205 [Streptomyces sp. FXJ1.172]
MTVQDHGVLTAGAEAGLTFGSPTTPVPGMVTPCTIPPPSPPNPCVTQPALPGGSTLKLAVDGLPVLLDSAHGFTASGAGPGTWSVVDPGQSILEAT